MENNYYSSKTPLEFHIKPAPEVVLPKVESSKNSSLGQICLGIIIGLGIAVVIYHFVIDYRTKKEGK